MSARLAAMACAAIAGLLLLTEDHGVGYLRLQHEAQRALSPREADARCPSVCDCTARPPAPADEPA